MGDKRMPNTVPTMLLSTRFGLGIQDRRWFDHRLQLIEAITAASLANQTRQDFVWAVFVDPSLDPLVRGELQRIIQPAGRAIIDDQDTYNGRSAHNLAMQLNLDRDGYVLTARLDDDDAWHRQTVEKVYRVAADWLERRMDMRHPGVAITFPHGLEWLMYDMVDIDKRAEGRHVVRRQSLRNYTYPFLGTSVFVLADTQTGITALANSHSKMAETLPRHGLDLLIQDDEPAMWLYVRHKQTVSSLQKARSDAMEIDLQDLELRFGIDANLVTHYIASSGQHGYVVEKRTVWRRTELKKQLQTVNGRLAEPSLPADELKQLRRQQSDLERELEQITWKLVEDG